MKYNVAVIGATGLVGSMMLKVLSEKNFPIDNLFLFSSKKSAGKIINYCGKDYTVEELKEDSFEYRDIKVDNPSADEIQDWHEKTELPIKRFFNTSGKIYRENNIKDKLT